MTDRATLAVATVLCLVAAGCTTNVPFVGDPGTSPSDFVQGKQYTRWEIEVDYVTGFAPSGAALDFAESRMASLVDKPQGVAIMPDQVLPSQDQKPSTQHLGALSSRYQDKQTSGTTIVTHILYVDGAYVEDETLGVAIGHDLVVIFAETIRRGCTENIFCTDPSRIEEVVLTHELGHIIGLVNRGIPMVAPHEHPEEPRHSDNRDSIMWPSVDTRNLFDLLAPLGGGIPDDFDPHDRADVCAAGGRCA